MAAIRRWCPLYRSSRATEHTSGEPETSGAESPTGRGSAPLRMSRIVSGSSPSRRAKASTSKWHTATKPLARRSNGRSARNCVPLTIVRIRLE